VPRWALRIALPLNCLLIASPPPAREGCELRSIVISMSVCLSVHSHDTKTTGSSITTFLRMLPIAVALSSSDDIAIRYVLPVSCMTSCFHIMALCVIEYDNRTAEIRLLCNMAIISRKQDTEDTFKVSHLLQPVYKCDFSYISAAFD